MFTSPRNSSQSFFSGWATNQDTPINQETPQYSVAPAPESSSEARRLMEAIVCNIDRLALDAAAVMSGINTLQHADTAMKATEIVRFLPVQENQLPLMQTTLKEISGVSYVLPELEPMLRLFHDGRELMQGFVDDEKELGRERARIIYADRLQVVWSLICKSVKQLIDETSNELRLSLPLAYQQNSAVLSSLLTGAANGLSPCIDDDGHLYAPQLPQQRRWTRHTVLQRCHVEHGEKRFDAFVVDASAGGLGLEQMPELARNSQIRVTMECGRHFDCIVAWSREGRAGVRFPAPLLQNDPLLNG